ncbi:D-2-hydroxyacid dehydrogenase [Thiohalocapsa marina]|uniref:D-2-hydroxyacid dehydrogenase n=1 Tax=Thiohalocapsa marina TaxID=424902 RepID=A0A5M8FL48_9GAMM|nr:D-2-hydroxyacid dehydrogenase [Thiohalocapsa marina]KAA6181622.1 D-2-hydroxyacid dehydrogenase [Thiohalocapsa marina]
MSSRVVILDLGSIDPGDLDLSALDRVCNHWTRFDTTAAEQTAARIAAADVVVSNKVVIGAAEMDAAPGLRLICIAATGSNNVDLEAARARNIAVTNVTGYATPAVVQHVLAIMLHWATGLWQQHQAVRSGDWCRSPHFCLLGPAYGARVRELAGRRLGIVGFGELGQAVARAAEAFGMQVRVADRPGAPHQAGRVPLQALLPQVDVLSLHCPLTADTWHLIGARELALLSPESLLINTARGGIVDEQALADALRAGRPGAAAVDTLSVEPPPPDHPLLAADIPNLLVTPHAAWSSQEARQRLVDEIAANITAFRHGEGRNRIG